MDVDGVRTEDAEDRVRWRTMSCCGKREQPKEEDNGKRRGASSYVKESVEVFGHLIWTPPLVVFPLGKGPGTVPELTCGIIYLH